MAKKPNLFSDFIGLIKLTYGNWRNDRTLRLGAGLAYYVMFSIVPIVALSISIASIIFPRDEIVVYLQGQTTTLLGANVSEVSSYISNNIAPDGFSAGFASLGIFGLGSLIVTASFALLALQDSVNIIWGNPVAKGFHHTARRYMFSYVMVLALALILVASLVIQALVSFVENVIPLDGPLVHFLGSAITSVATWALLIVALAWLIRVLTSHRVGRACALLGAAVTIIFMYIGVYAIGFYLTNFSLKSVTSAFSAVLLVLAWAYYESQILLAGFQLTRALSEGKYHKK